jgi:hypothetical protein
MSYLRRVVALMMLALLGWLVAFGATGAPASASDASPPSTMTSFSVCC